MIVKYVCTRTIGKTFAGDPPSFHIQVKCALTGRSTISSAPTKKGAQISTSVYILTAGKSKSTILTSSRSSSVSMALTVRSLTVRITIAIVTAKSNYRHGSDTSQKLVSSRISRTFT